MKLFCAYSWSYSLNGEVLATVTSSTTRLWLHRLGLDNMYTFEALSEKSLTHIMICMHVGSIFECPNINSLIKYFFLSGQVNFFVTIPRRRSGKLVKDTLKNYHHSTPSIPPPPPSGSSEHLNRQTFVAQKLKI